MSEGKLAINIETQGKKLYSALTTDKKMEINKLDQKDKKVKSDDSESDLVETLTNELQAMGMDKIREEVQNINTH